jgi:hypothetical protein
MSLLKHLQFQQIDKSDDDIPEDHRQEEDIDLKEQIDEQKLESYWTEVVQDLEKDPKWFKFSDD